MGNGINGNWAGYSSTSLTGTSVVDSIIALTKWNLSTSSPTLYYSFPSGTAYSDNDYSEKSEWSSWTPLSSNDKYYTSVAFGEWSKLANITFTLVSDNATQAGDIRIAYYNDMTDAGGWAYYPWSDASAGDIWLNPTDFDADPTPGTWEFATILHEIGHALGLKHSFDAKDGNSNVLPTDRDYDFLSVMSYTDVSSAKPVTPSIFDIRAIQSLYGANTSVSAGNNTYELSSGHQTIWDTGGTDTVTMGGKATNFYINRLCYSGAGDNEWQVFNTTNTAGGIDTLVGVEKFQFSDETFTMDLYGAGASMGLGSNLSSLRDYGGNDVGFGSDWKLKGVADIDGNGKAEYVLANAMNGRWATLSPSSGQIDYSRHGSGGINRVVGVYEDPLVSAGTVTRGSDTDSATRFQRDISADRFILLGCGDFDGNGIRDTIWKVRDGDNDPANDVYLRGLMHSDGNIRYANYLSRSQFDSYIGSSLQTEVLAMWHATG